MRDFLDRLWMRTLMSLPPAMLRAMSGGAAVHAQGRTLDPRLQYLAHIARIRPASSGLEPEEARASDARDTAITAPPAEPGVTQSTLNVPTPAGLLEARLYRPAEQDPSKAPILYLHAGGGVIGDLNSGAAVCGLLAAATGAPVVSLAYRLAPEYRFPAGFEDSLAAYRWLRAESAVLGGPAERASVCGASIGAGFAAGICQALAAAGEAQPDLQILLYPLLDATDPVLRDPAAFDQGWPLSQQGMAWSRDHYLGPEADTNDPRLAPGQAASIAGLAPALIGAAGFDPLRDQARAYALKLKAAGVTVVYRQYDSLTHDFGAFTGLVPAAGAACRELATLAAEMLNET